MAGTEIDGNTYDAYGPPVSQSVSADDTAEHTVQFRTIDQETAVTSNLMSDHFGEAGDTLATAQPTGHDGSTLTETHLQEIGDNALGALDVDLYEVDLDNAGDWIVADAVAGDGSALDPAIRIFNSAGTELAQSAYAGRLVARVQGPSRCPLPGPTTSVFPATTTPSTTRRSRAAASRSRWVPTS